MHPDDPPSKPVNKPPAGPSASPQALAVMLWRMVFAGVFGLANVLLHLVGLFVLTGAFVMLIAALNTEHYAGPQGAQQAAQSQWFYVQVSRGGTPVSERYSRWLARAPEQRPSLVTLKPGDKAEGLSRDEAGVYQHFADGTMWDSSSSYRIEGDRVVPVSLWFTNAGHALLAFALAFAVIALLRWLARRWLARRQARTMAAKPS